MTTAQNPESYLGLTAVDPDQDKIGSVAQVYVNDDSGVPDWVTVHTGLFGNRENFVPLEGSRIDGDNLVLPFTKSVVKDAPEIADASHLDPDESADLYSYYEQHRAGSGVRSDPADSDTSVTRSATDSTSERSNDLASSGPDYGGTEATTGSGYSDNAAAGYARDTAGPGDTAGYARDTADPGNATGYARDTEGPTGTTGDDTGTAATGHDTSGPTTDQAMTRSEEHLNVGTERVEAGRARLRKYVVTEQQTVTVPVSHEEIRVERVPVTDENRGDAVAGPAISEEEHEVVLHAERPVVTTEAVPVERVRLTTETVTEDQQVSGEVRKEQIEIEDDGVRSPGDR